MQVLSPTTMWFYLTSIDPQNQTRKFSFYISQLEKGFDTLNQLVASGVKLTSVQLVDGDSVINLPIESFDGDSSAEWVEELERVWQSILEQPTLYTATLRVAVLILINRHMAIYANQIERINPLLKRAEAILLRSKEMNLSHHNQGLIKTFQRTLSFYQNQLDRAYHNRQRLQKTIDDSIYLR